MYSVSDKVCIYIVKGFKKKNFYMLLIVKLNVYLFNFSVFFYVKRKKKKKKERKKEFE